MSQLIEVRSPEPEGKLLFCVRRAGDGYQIICKPRGSKKMYAVDIQQMIQQIAKGVPVTGTIIN